MFSVKRFFHFLILIIFSTPASKWLQAWRLRSLSCSQLHQDIFALTCLNFKRNGFFVEFGACDGQYLSNTYLLERIFGWNGVLAEPTRRWHTDLVINRQKSFIDRRCVWRVSGALLEFNEGEDPALSGLFSRESQLASVCSFQVETVSLADLLRQSNAPQEIDFLSIDTEGSEWDIIRDFNFNSFDIRVVCIEKIE